MEFPDEFVIDNIITICLVSLLMSGPLLPDEGKNKEEQEAELSKKLNENVDSICKRINQQPLSREQKVKTIIEFMATLITKLATEGTGNSVFFNPLTNIPILIEYSKEAKENTRPHKKF